MHEKNYWEQIINKLSDIGEELLSKQVSRPEIEIKVGEGLMYDFIDYQISKYKNFTYLLSQDNIPITTEINLPSCKIIVKKYE